MIKRLLMVASYPESIVGFRGELIREMVARGIEVHVAAPVGGGALPVTPAVRVTPSVRLLRRVLKPVSRPSARRCTISRFRAPA